MTVSAFLEILKEANGKTFTGYKGGDFKMDDNTLMWVGNYGECYDTAITGVSDKSWCVVLETGWVE